MITVGIDLGAKTTKVVIVKDGELLSQSLVLTGFDQEMAAEQALKEALQKAGLQREEIEQVVATGAGSKAVPFADHHVTDIGADARGATFLFPSTRTVIDVGAEEGRGIRCDEKGKVVDFAINEKCAAGAGAFTEAMARALELELEEMGELSLQSTKAVPMNAQCTIFAESEVVSLIHAKTSKADIVRAVHDAIASRISSMVRRVGIEKDVTLIGGVARNVGFVDSLQRGLEVKLLVPEEPEFVGALGAALVAADGK
ncbi:MAG: acyl-CoA dehydratase activase [Anaerolineae bacterium]